MLPVKIKNEYYVHKSMKEIGVQFTLLSFLKLLLQEVEKIAIVNFQSSPENSAEVIAIYFKNHLFSSTLLTASTPDMRNPQGCALVRKLIIKLVNEKPIWIACDL